MTASRDDAGASPIPATTERRIEAFLEMLAAERGAARLTVSAYRADLEDIAAFLAPRGVALESADVPAKHYAGEGLIHGFFSMGDASEIARNEAQLARADFKALLNRQR